MQEKVEMIKKYNIIIKIIQFLIKQIKFLCLKEKRGEDKKD
jgi:hypothetical protein